MAIDCRNGKNVNSLNVYSSSSTTAHKQAAFIFIEQPFKIMKVLNVLRSTYMLYLANSWLNMCVHYLFEKSVVSKH